MTPTRPLFLVLIAPVLITGCGGHIAKNSSSTSNAKRRSPAAIVSSRNTEATIARRFATAYARYLDGKLPAAALPDATSTTRTQAGPTIPPARRTGPLTIQSITPIPATATFIVAWRDRARVFNAQLTLRWMSEAWLVVSVQSPDLDTILATAPSPVPQPAGSGSAEHAANVFIGAYLAWLYRHAPLQAITTATAALLTGLKLSPPRIPPTMQARHPKVVAIAMQRRGHGWQALANIADGHETYELVLTVIQTRGRWLISNVSLSQ
jgi:hypothetical protein